MSDVPIPPEFMETGADPIDDYRWMSIIRAAEDVAAELDAEVSDVLADPSGAVDGEWEISGEGTAQWAMAKVAEASARVDERQEQASRWRAQIDAWLSAATRDDERTVTYFEGKLSRWALARRAANPKGPATFKLVAGDVATRAYSAVADIADVDEVVEWCKTHGHAELVKVKETVGVSDLRRVVQLRDRVVGSEVMLACGHSTSVSGQSSAGEMVACVDSKCQWAKSRPDGDRLVPVVGIVSNDVTQCVLPQLPLGEDAAEPIPGTRVNPERVTVTIKPHT